MLNPPHSVVDEHFKYPVKFRRKKMFSYSFSNACPPARVCRSKTFVNGRLVFREIMLLFSNSAQLQLQSFCSFKGCHSHATKHNRIFALVFNPDKTNIHVYCRFTFHSKECRNSTSWFHPALCLPASEVTVKDESLVTRGRSKSPSANHVCPEYFVFTVQW